MSRPSIYNDTILDKSRLYLESFRDVEVIPTIEGLALYLNLARSTLYEWERQYEEFSDILETLRAKQAQILISNGLQGKFNPTMSKMMLSKHGYYEQRAPMRIIDPDTKVMGITYVTPVEIVDGQGKWDTA